MISMPSGNSEGRYTSTGSRKKTTLSASELHEKSNCAAGSGKRDVSGDFSLPSDVFGGSSMSVGSSRNSGSPKMPSQQSGPYLCAIGEEADRPRHVHVHTAHERGQRDGKGERLMGERGERGRERARTCGMDRRSCSFDNRHDPCHPLEDVQSCWIHHECIRGGAPTWPPTGGSTSTAQVRRRTHL